MTDDIVTRLRADYEFAFNRFTASIPSLMQAADEIERLRKELITEQTLVMLGQVQVERLRAEIERLKNDTK